MLDGNVLSLIISRLGQGTVAIVGSRTLPMCGLSLAALVAEGVWISGRAIVTGCCVGVDQAVMRAACGSGQLTILAAFGQYGEGACTASARFHVQAAAIAGANVVWWAGGPETVPLGARLARRSQAVAAFGSGGLIAVMGSHGSVGSMHAVHQAVKLGRPVVAICAGFRPRELYPVLGGVWSVIGELAPGFIAASWEPALL